MRINRKNILLLITGVITITLTIFTIVFRGNGANYYITVEELINGKTPNEEAVRVSGRVVGGSIDFDQSNSRFNFKIASAEGGKEVDVIYYGLPPRSFTPDSKVIVEGVYNSKIISAKNLLVKCPEKYLPEKAISGSGRILGIDGLLYR